MSVFLNSASAVVFGGAHGWGKRAYDSLQSMAKNTRIIEKDASRNDIGEAIEKSQVIFLAIPDNDINGLLVSDISILTKGKTIIDCATNKSGFAKTLKQIGETGASVCSTHPMVAAASSPRGQNVLIMPVGNNSDSATTVAKDIFKTMGMNIEDFDFDRHADAMVILQMVPHLIQRILIDALSQGIPQQSMRIEDLSRLAPANYLLAELGLGRVATQRPDVSAGIIATGLKETFGREILGRIKSTLGRIISAGESRDELTDLFQGSVDNLDPTQKWRKYMETKTEAALIRIGNLRSRHFVVEVPNKPGVLRDILSILTDNHKIDMTAIDSQVVEDLEGFVSARFDIGITDEYVDFEKLFLDLNAIGVNVVDTTDN